ncbi:MAG: porin [Porphyromonadaceae bacterium]|nr:MAG: porin [Porphyromonadaceae bacterium]
MKSIKTTLVLLVLLTAPFTGARMSAQIIETPKPDTVYPILEKLQSDVSLFSRLKISGYIQSQFQKADTAGIESFAGGNFPAGIDNRFAVRRGRFKLAYDYAFSQYVLQVDVTEKGVGIKDAYVSFTDPWLQCFAITAGVFDRPFGYEISYSSSSRESPERSRMFQTLFPGERDLGARFTFQPPKTSRFNFIKLDAGLFNGTGPNVVDFDRYKDFISHLSINKTNRSEKVKVGLGVSYYNGGWRQGTKYNYSMNDVTLPAGNIMALTVDSTSSAIGNKLRREYFGADAQVSYDSPLGLTILRGEFITGTQPGVAKSAVSPSAQPVTDAYIRKFNGAYFYLVQNIFQTKYQLVVKYDWFDPNTAVTGNEIGVKVTGSNKATGAYDAKYSTLGIGWVYKWNSQVKITAYYDYVLNETTTNIEDVSTLKDLSNDRHDNVFTLRLQYKF